MRDDSILLKDKFAIYNNLATSGDSSGRLSINFNIYPAPTIFWEFETGSKDDPKPKYDGSGKLSLPFMGKFLNMPDARAGSSDEISVHKAIGYLLVGSTPRVVIGDETLVGKSFSFYLPNAAFQEVGERTNFRTREVFFGYSQNSRELGDSFREGFAKMSIENEFTLSVNTPRESINWLKSRYSRKSVGTYLTTLGNLEVDNAISIYDAKKMLDDITFLLSFANGGFIAPLVVEMQDQGFEKEYPSIYSAHIIDPVEHIMSTWFDSESDIVKLLECFPAFQKMLRDEPWKNNFHTVLTWYFQAVQPSKVQQIGKPWHVAANALGATLEKLASIILVDEIHIVSGADFRKKWSLERRIKELLQAIGITEIMEYDTETQENGVKDVIWWFAKMRNDATHSQRDYIWTEEKVNIIGRNAIQWIEEILLWRLGYRGEYRDRSHGDESSTLPRYNLALRDPSW